MLANLIPSSTRWRFQTAMILALAADALQIFVFPFFAEGAWSPADDVLDLAVAAVLVHLLGWHWEFLPAFLAELVPGVNLAPFWTLAVISVYRKWKQITITTEETRGQRPALKRPAKFFVSRESQEDQDGAMQSSLRFANLSRAVDGGFVVRLVSVTDNTSAADHARYRETKIAYPAHKKSAPENHKEPCFRLG